MMRIASVLWLSLAPMLSGCMTFAVEGDGEKTANSVTGTATVHSSLYGFDWSNWLVERCVDSRALYRVEYHTNAVYLVTSLVSLGLYAPQTVTWWCDDSRHVDDNGEEEYVPEGKLR